MLASNQQTLRARPAEPSTKQHGEFLCVGAIPVPRIKTGQQTSVLIRLDKDPLALLRQSYIAIRDGNHCPAMVLADLEYHQNRHLNDDGSVDWFQRSIDCISRDLFREYSPNSVRAALKQLRAKGYVEVQRSPAGDKAGQYYRLNAESINGALAAYDSERKSRTPPKMEGFKTGGVPPQNRYGTPLQETSGTPPKTSGFLEEKIRKRTSSSIVADAGDSDCVETENPREVLKSHPKSVAAMRRIEPLRSEAGNSAHASDRQSLCRLFG